MATPFGMLGIRAGGGYVTRIAFVRRRGAEVAPADALAERVWRQIEGYLADPGYRFSLPLAEIGTPFQRRVWGAIAAIPPGCTRTYGAIASELGSSARAVGQACGENPYPLVVPCHRVVSSSGIGGFAHSAEGYLPGVKLWLLAHERDVDRTGGAAG